MKPTLRVSELELSGAITWRELEHGEDCNGKNYYEVVPGDFCSEACEWCQALIRRCQSRGGGVLKLTTGDKP